MNSLVLTVKNTASGDEQTYSYECSNGASAARIIDSTLSQCNSLGWNLISVVGA